MSSYNDNLHASVVDSLQTQELDLKKVKAQQNASMFTLYYAEGASITAGEQLAKSTVKLDEKTYVKNQAVTDSNIANNLLKSATQYDQYIKQSVSNASVCAANVQIAANAIVKLASDLGSIYSIVHAADAGTDIYLQAKNARSLIDSTAYNAELASQKAMELSMATSEVSSSTVLDKAKLTTNLMNNMLKVASDDFTTASALVNTDNATLATVSATEKLAEGDFEDITVDFRATLEAYGATNTGLNHALGIKNLTPGGFTAQFLRIVAPFNQQPGYYPVSKYYLFIVKDSKKSIFTIANAENLLLTGLNNITKTVQYIPVQLPEIKPNHGIIKKLVSQEVTLDGIEVPGNTGKFTLYDSDNEIIELGTRYVVFMMAEYMSEYKKMLNDFSDYLSAPTPYFAFTNHLKAVEVKDITIENSGDYPISFVSHEAPEILSQVEYRCIFLPVYDNFSDTLITKAAINELQLQVEELDRIADLYEPRIGEVEEELANLESDIAVLAGQNTDATHSELSKKQEQYKKLQADLKKLFGKIEEAEKNIRKMPESPVGFLFNLEIAEQVLPGNYTPATTRPSVDTGKGKDTGSEQEAGTGADKSPATSASKDKHVKDGGKYYVPVTSATTDNFGNALVKGYRYIPVILSVPGPMEKDLDTYTNAWSGYKGFPKYFTF